MKRKSNRRQLQAEATRQDILKAARRLIGERGYSGTSISEIAAAAETAIQTVYASVGPKRAVMLGTLDVIEDEAGIAALSRAIDIEQRPRELIRLMVNIMRSLHEHCGDLLPIYLGGATADRDIGAVIDLAHEHHDDGARRIIAKIDAQAMLRDGLPPERAFAMLSGFVWGSSVEFVGHHGWSLDEYESWLTESLCQLLLKDDAP